LWIADCGLSLTSVAPHEPALQIRNPKSAIRNYLIRNG